MDGMSERRINPRVVTDMADRINDELGTSCDAVTAERLIRGFIKSCKQRGLFEGPYERSMKYLVPDEVAGRNGRVPKYPFYRMEVGESVLIPRHDQSAALDAARSYANRNGVRFVHAPDQDSGGVRVWRQE